MKPDFIYFDLDNTLLNHSSAEQSAQRATYDAYPELHQVPIDNWLEAYRLINHQLWEKYQKNEISRHQLQHARFHDTMKQFNLHTGLSTEIGEAYMTNYRKYWVWINGAQNALEKVSNKFKTGIITNGFKETQELKFESLQLNRYCSTFLISEDIGKMKPHPEVFDRATEMAGVDRGRILYVGDSYSSDIEGGENAGWNTAWFTGLLSDVPDAHKEKATITFSEFGTLLNYLEV